MNSVLAKGNDRATADVPIVQATKALLSGRLCLAAQLQLQTEPIQQLEQECISLHTQRTRRCKSKYTHSGKNPKDPVVTAQMAM